LGVRLDQRVVVHSGEPGYKTDLALMAVSESPFSKGVSVQRACNASALRLPQRNSPILEIDVDSVDVAVGSDVWLQQANDLLDRVQAP
jgi:hypothetical protein